MKLEAKARLVASVSASKVFQSLALAPEVKNGNLQAIASNPDFKHKVDRLMGNSSYIPRGPQERVSKNYWGYFWMLPNSDQLFHAVGIGGGLWSLTLRPRSDFPKEFYAALRPSPLTTKPGG